MERLLTRLDRRFGRYAPENVIIFIVGLTGILHLVAFARPELVPLFWLDPEAVMRGEVWRVVTFLFAASAPIGSMYSLIWWFLGLWLVYTMGTSLEAQWGALRFDLFFLIGWLGTLAVGFLLGSPVTGTWLASAMFLAFAAEFPDFQIMLMMILPIKVKWLGLATAVLLIYEFFQSGLADRVAIAVAVADLFLLCGGVLRDRMRGVSRSVAQTRRVKPDTGFGPIPRKARVCAKCGRSSAEERTLEFRVCDCQETCGGKLTEYCIEHAKPPHL
jgi:hypothetical protein